MGTRQYILTPDIVIAEGVATEPMPRDNVVYFAECKSVNHASMEHIAAAMGQRFLIKRGFPGTGTHPYKAITDTLIIRGTASNTIKRFCSTVASRGWLSAVEVVDRISPGQPDTQTLQNMIAKIVQKL